MIAFLRFVFNAPEPINPELRAQLDAFKVAQVDGDLPIKAPRYVFTDTEEFPSREEARTKLAEAENQAEMRWLIQEREKEREAMNAHQPRNKVVQIGRVKA